MMAFAFSSESSPRDRPRTFPRSPCGSATKLHLANRPQTATSGSFSTPFWATRRFSRIATGLKRRALFTPVLEEWAKEPDLSFPNYPAGAWGPGNGATPFGDEPPCRDPGGYFAQERQEQERLRKGDSCK